VRRPVVTTPETWAASETDVRRTRVYYWWLLLVIAFEYARPDVFVPVIGAIKLPALIPMTLFAAVLFAPGLRPFKAIFTDRTTRWIVLYLALILLSVPMAIVTLYATNTLKVVSTHFTLFLIIARVATTLKRLHGIFLVLFASHLFVLAMNPDVILNPYVRSYVRGAYFLGDGNDFALSLCILMPISVYLAQGARSRLMRAVAWAGFLATILAIIGTQSRGGALGGCAVLGFLWLTSKQKAAALMGIGVVAAVVVAFGSQAYFDRMSSIRDYQSEGSAQARVTAWKAATRMALANPLLGVGAGHFPMAYAGKYRPPDVGYGWMTAHSMYFLVLGELGFPGIIAFCAIVFGGIRAAMMVRRRLLQSEARAPPDSIDAHSRLLVALAASSAGFAVAGAFLSVAYYPHVMVLSGLLLSGRSIAVTAHGVARPSQAGHEATGRRPHAYAARGQRRGARASRAATSEDS
jgi:probable O-glycosylation ligase (exosortase A-associated)